MNIFVHELKANLRSLIIWGVIVILFVVMGIAKFSAYYNNPEMLVVLKAIPPAMLAAMNLEAFNLTTLNGFFGLMFTYFALMLCIAAAMWGSDVITKEERDRTVEFALTLPVTRRRVVTAKTLAALVNCVALLLIAWGASLLSAQQYQPDDTFYRFLTLSMVALFFMQVVFLAVGVLLGCALKQYKRATGMAVAILLTTYFLSVLSGLSANLSFLKYLSPFKYFDAGTLLRDSRIDPGYLALSLIIVVVCMTGAYIAYQRRDLYI